MLLHPLNQLDHYLRHLREVHARNPVARVLVQRLEHALRVDRTVSAGARTVRGRASPATLPGLPARGPAAVCRWLAPAV